MRSILIAGSVQGNPSLYADCGKFENDDSFYLHVIFSTGEIRGIVSREQLERLIEMLYAESGGDKEE